MQETTRRFSERELALARLIRLIAQLVYHLQLEVASKGLEQLAAQAPAGRPATADEIAEAIVFLATNRASLIRDAKLAVDGGRTAI